MGYGNNGAYSGYNSGYGSQQYAPIFNPIEYNTYTPTGKLSNKIVNEFGVSGKMQDNLMNKYSTYNLDRNLMLNLGFEAVEVDDVIYIITHLGNLTTQALQNMGYDYERIKRMKYMADIMSGKVGVSTKQDMQKHLKRMFGGHRRIGINDLMVSKISEVPKLAVIANIKGPFSVYNSCNMKRFEEKVYEVENVSSSRITVRTNRKPVLKYGEPKKVNGIYEFLDEKARDGRNLVAFGKDYIRLINRYIIVATLRRPEFYLSMLEIIAKDGTMVYVFAQNLEGRKNVSYKGGTQRIYDWGFNPGEIKNKVMAVGQNVYNTVNGVLCEFIPANCDYTLYGSEYNNDDGEECNKGIVDGAGNEWE